MRPALPVRPTRPRRDDMMRPLGSKQRELLGMLSSPTRFMIVGNAVAESLARRGLLAAQGEDGTGFFQITPAGLRVLADEWEAGRLEFKLDEEPK